MLENVITTKCLEFTESNFKFSVTINNYKDWSKTFNIKINNDKIKFNPEDLKVLMLFPKIVTAFIRTPYPDYKVEIDIPILDSEYYPLEVITHLNRRKLSATVDYNLPKSRMIYWNKIPLELNYKGTPAYNTASYDTILPISGGRDSMLVRCLLEEGNKSVFDFIMNYGGYRWSLFEKDMTYNKLPSVGIYPAEFGINYGGIFNLYKPFKFNSSQSFKKSNIREKDYFVDLYCFSNYIIGLLLSTKFGNSYVVPAIERPHYKYKKNDGIWAYMFDETQLITETIRELCVINNINDKIASPIIMLNDVVEYDLLHKLGYKKYGSIITSCGFGRNRWCYRCHKDLQAYLRLMINNINPELYGMNVEELSKKNPMIKSNIEKYNKYIYNNREIISKHEFGYIHNYVEENNIKLPKKLESFLNLFPINNDKNEIFNINTNEYSFLPDEFKYIKKYLDKYPKSKIGRKIKYSTFSDLTLPKRIEFIAKTNNIKEHILI